MAEKSEGREKEPGGYGPGIRQAYCFGRQKVGRYLRPCGRALCPQQRPSIYRV
jgi:hypothetical protein